MNGRVGLELSIDRLHCPRVTAVFHCIDRSTNTKYIFYEWNIRGIPDLNLMLNKLQSMSSHVRYIIIKLVRQLCAIHRGSRDLHRLTRSHINACSLGQTDDKRLYEEIGEFYSFDISQTVRRIQISMKNFLELTPE